VNVPVEEKQLHRALLRFGGNRSTGIGIFKNSSGTVDFVICLRIFAVADKDVDE